MSHFTKFVFILMVIVSQSCKITKPPTQIGSLGMFSNTPYGTTVHNRYYRIFYNLPDTKMYAEEEVNQVDSITAMKAEFEKLVSEINDAKNATEIDTGAKYVLKFISEQHSGQRLGSRAGKTYTLKKCDQIVGLKYFSIQKQFLTSYSNKYLVYTPFPIADVGNTYNWVLTSQFYFEKI